MKRLWGAMLLSLTAFIGIFIFLNAPPKTVPQGPGLTIPAGISGKAIAQKLKEAHLVKSSFFFETLAWTLGARNKLRAGLYRWEKPPSAFRILRDLSYGNVSRVKVTIPEGYTAREIAELLQKKGVCSGEDFLKEVSRARAEGFLFPQTYYFDENSRVLSVLDLLRQTAKVALAECGISPDETPRALILASIIEREAKTDEERNLISGVFHNRLKKGWPLESCATVLYALGGHKTQLSLRDLKVKSPYNTYLRAGLPPGPICNPGLASLKAAIQPAETDALFFVADGSGTHRFSRFYREHLKAKRTVSGER